ncbi:unnamed protein product [Cladocopium goreaui]|uniref:Uncharacterized protein n=1 Tax=Cladocopium goreaui TaxID=2562237 RepID=A0A9P1CI97_9DINO|nr:unnamed protein product [Cladocopium goreaui]
MEPIRLPSFLHCIVTRKLSVDLSRSPYAVEIVSHDDVEARMILPRIAPLTWQLRQLGFRLKDRKSMDSLMLPLDMLLFFHLVKGGSCRLAQSLMNIGLIFMGCKGEKLGGGHLNSLFRYSPSPRRLPAIFVAEDLSLPLPRCASGYGLERSPSDQKK